MAGIINYYHGESGFVSDRRHIVNQEQRVHVLRLQGNPHRKFAYDYQGGDVHIDPLLNRGDTAFFVRVDPYGGIWVREQDRYFPMLQQAIDRVVTRDKNCSDPNHKTIRAQGIWGEQYIADDTRRKTGNPFPERPATEASFFLSFSSRNVMLARQIFEDLTYDAQAEVWFDLDQAGDSPEHRRRIERWLREAVYNSQGFILLWTKAAKESPWVSKEIEWAAEKASREQHFNFIILKLDDEPVIEDKLNTSHVIDCHDLWPINGINEELFASIVRRPGRTAWLEQHLRRGIELLGEEEGNSGYEPFRSDSGIAVSLRHWEEDGELCWQLTYERAGRFYKAFGRGKEQAVDFDIRPGDEVGLFVCHRAPLIRYWPGTPLWMRSGDLGIRPEDVLGMYRQKSGAKNTPIPDLSLATSTSDQAVYRAEHVSVIDGDTAIVRPRKSMSATKQWREAEESLRYTPNRVKSKPSGSLQV